MSKTKVYHVESEENAKNEVSPVDHGDDDDDDNDDDDDEDDDDNGIPFKDKDAK